LEITQTDRYIWQRRAAALLVKLLDEHRDLPPIAWMVGTGSQLVGRVSGLQPAATARAEFEAWADALELGKRHEYGDAVTHLSARTRRDSVDLAVMADLIHNDDEERR
jgi:hypothetical protein